MGWFERLFRRSRKLAQGDLDRAYAQIEVGNYGPAIATLEDLVAAGVPRACNALAKCHIEGLGVDPDPAAARRWLETGAEAGDALSQRNLGLQHLLGDEGSLFREKSVAQAVGYFERAAKQGDAPAQDHLSTIYFDDIDREGNAAKAFFWAKKAAEGGMPASMAHLATIYHEGLGVRQDFDLASRWCRAAAERGHGGSQLMLATALLYGIRTPADPVGGLTWALRAHHNQGGRNEMTAAIVRKGLEFNDAAGVAEAERRAREPLPRVGA